MARTRYRATVALLLSLLLAGSFLHGATEPALPWHQCYEPVEDPAALAYVDSCFKEARRLFGEPVLPVREIHIRYTRIRKDRYALTRAAFRDLKRLADRLLSGETPALKRLQSWLTPGTRTLLQEARTTPLTRTKKLQVTGAFNRFINNPRFYQDPLFTRLTQKTEKGFRFRLRLRRPSHQEKNRAVLNALFPESLLPGGKPPLAATKFNLCECADRERGIFVIYTASKPGTDRFYLELAHEAAHLLNADLFDWYVEGANNVFAERMAKAAGRSWEPWRKLFHRGRKKEPYALSYNIMHEVMDAAGEDGMKLFLQAAEPRNDSDRQHINISRWLSALPIEKAGAVDSAISRHAARLLRAAGTKNAFQIPHTR